MVTLVNTLDWSKTPLGPVSSWPSSLRTTVSTLLQSRHPMFLWWGPELIQFYNDAYLPSFGEGKHPTALGQRGADCWGEIWPIIGPQIEAVMSRGSASWNEDHLVPIYRNGRIEEVYWTYSYSPVNDDRGAISGTLVVCTETTSRVLMERRLQSLRRLLDATSACEEIAALSVMALAEVAVDDRDIPFALHYRAESNTEPRLTRCQGLDRAAAALLDRALRARGLLRPGRRAPQLVAVDPSVPEGPWSEHCSQAVVIESAEPELGSFVFGISARLPFDRAYEEYLSDFVATLERAALRIESSRARTAMEAERRNLLLQAPVAAALMIGPEHRFELANARFTTIARRDVVGLRCAEAFPELAGTPLLAVLGSVYTSGRPFSTDEFRIPLGSQHGSEPREVFVQFSLEPLRNGAGVVYGMIAVVVDITEQVRARQLLERTYQERERLLGELELASRAKDSFLAAVSHELRTPLNSILGWARILRSAELPPDKVRHALEVIERNSIAQAQLIEDLLDVSRIVAGKLRLELSPVALGAIAEAAVVSMEHAIAAKGILCELHIDPAAGTVSGDPHRLQQVVWNLLNNAVKFTPKGGRIRIGVERAGASAQLSVSDTGQGIPPHLISQLFEPFKQADGSSARVHGGLGLGLAIARHIVDLHGGSLEAYSEGVGRGATFRARLPLATAPSDERGPLRSAESEPPELDRPKELQGLSILLVDDDADTREVLQEQLQRLGASVLSASSAPEALALLDRASPRVIVSDLGMPHMDGYAFMQAVRERPREKGGLVVAVALTAFASPDDRRKALEAGFHMHLSKPVEPSALVAALTTLAQLSLALE